MRLEYQYRSGDDATSVDLSILLPPPYIVALIWIAAGIWIAYRQYRRNRPTRITGLYIYPIKSCQGIRLESAELTRLGFQYDRQFMIVNAHTGNMTTARELPHMVLIAPTLDDARQTMTLSFPDHGPLTIPLTPPETPQEVLVWESPLQARRYGPIVSKWITSVLTSRGPAPSPNAPPAEFHLVSIISTEQHQRAPQAIHDWNGPDANITSGFSDGFPILLASESSLRKLNSWTRPQRTVEMLAFRPNIIIDGGSLKEFDEDHWRMVRIGEDQRNTFVAAKPCERCIMTTVVPAEGVRHKSGTNHQTAERKIHANHCTHAHMHIHGT